MKKAIIIGATSGIGQEVAKCLLLDGWQIGVAGRRQSALENLQRAAPDQIQIQTLDVTQEDAGEKLNMLIDKVGGMDLFLLSSGIGFQNTYIDALEQLSYLQKLNIRFTDIRPGFVATDLLNDGKHYPLLMDAAKVGRHIAWSLERKQRIVVIDWRYRILVFFWKMIPRWMWKRLPVKTN